MKKAALYARVSTDSQAEKELSIPAQIKELKEYADKHEMKVVKKYIDEGVSAKTDDRPEFQKMISEAKQDPRPFDVILYHKNDRFARNREDAIVYKSLLRRDCDIELIAIKEDFGEGPVAQMIEGILEVIAEFYSQNLAQEVKKGMREKAKQGKALGEAPRGYEIGEDGYYKIVHEEAEIVNYIFKQYTKNEKGLMAIASDLRLNGQKYFGEKGNKYNWSANGIKVILKNETYTGTMVWNKRDNAKNYKIRDKKDWIRVPGSHEAIIKTKTYEKAQKRLENNFINRSDSKDYLLKGIVKCMNCGSNMTQYSDKWKLKDGTQRETRHLRCSGYMHGDDCYFNHIKMETAEKKITNFLSQVARGKININKQNMKKDKTDIEKLIRT